MPNWSYNHLRISGKPEDMKSFLEKAIVDSQFKFSNIIPQPDKIRRTISPTSAALGKHYLNEDIRSIRDNAIGQIVSDEKALELIPCENSTPEKCIQLRSEYGSDNWYDWNIANWGTKWDVNVTEEEFSMSETTFRTSFDTAWSPPGTFLYKLHKMFPKLDIHLVYELEGDSSCGQFITYDGQLEVEESQVSYIGSDGREIYWNKEKSEFCYVEDDEVCYEYESVNLSEQ